MDLNEIGTRLVELCREGRNAEAIEELYSDDIVNVEPMDPPEGDRETHGLEAVKAKTKWWMENHEIHDADIQGPYPDGVSRFCVRFAFDVTNVPSGERMKMDEIGLYTVADGKIVREEFFYS